MIKSVPGTCIKSQKPLVVNGRPLACFNEVLLRLDNGTLCHVAIDKDQWLEESEFPALSQELFKDKICKVVEEKGLPVAVPCQILEVVDRLKHDEIMKSLRANVCFKCGKSIGDKWIVTNGRTQHERC